MLELSQSIKEFKKDNYIEGVGKLLISSVRGYQALPYLQVSYQVHKEQISSFITKQRENIARAFHFAAASLASPFWWYTEKTIRVFSPIRLDKQDQCSSYVQEIAARAFYSMLAFPFLPATLALTLAEGACRIAANTIQPKPFFYLKGKAEEKNSLGKNIKIFTMNVCAVAGGFPRLFGGVGPWKYRANEIINQILSEKPDVVCLQEVNDINAAYAFKKGLENEYAHFYFNVGSKTFTQNSGHFIASKYPIEDMNFMPFSKKTGLQSMVNKGLCSFALKCKDEVFAHIFDVHLSPSKDDLNAKEQEIEDRKIELERILKQIELKEKNDPESFKVLVGDMNLRWGSDEWKQSIISSNKFMDPYNQGREKVTSKDATCATDDMIDAYHKSKERDWLKSPMILDYTLLYNSKQKREITTKKVKAFDPKLDPYDAISDHSGLVIKISTGY